MHDYQETLEWYRENQTARDIGFNPDGMCLKICRTARDIGPKYLTAKQSQDAVPPQHRVHKVRDLRKGMNLYFDDPNDSNKAGHIVTQIGRVKGFDVDDLNDVLVETNSVVSGQLVIVRATYFTKHWGDPFQFGSTWLNGQVLDVPSAQSRVYNFKHSGPNWNVRMLDRAIDAGRSELKPKVHAIDKAVADLPDDKRSSRVTAFKEAYEKHRVLRMPLLNDAVNKGDRHGTVKKDRDRLQNIIKSVPNS